MADDGYVFRGFSKPTYTQVPDELFDELMPRLSEAELKVLLYVVRRTFGFKKDSDTISLKQMVEGIKTRDGRQLDNGTGLSRPGVSKGVKGLVTKGVLIAIRNASVERGDEPTTYQLRFADPVATVLRGGRQDRFVPLPHDVSSLRGNAVTPQETVDQQTEEQETDRRVEDSNSHTPDYDNDRLTLLPYVEDFAREMNDEASLSVSLSRMVNLYKRSGLDLDAFIEKLYAARALTKERSASITKEGNGSGPWAKKNKMPYLFAVLEDIVAGDKA